MNTDKKQLVSVLQTFDFFACRDEIGNLLWCDFVSFVDQLLRGPRKTRKVTKRRRSEPRTTQIRADKYEQGENRPSARICVIRGLSIFIWFRPNAALCSSVLIRGFLFAFHGSPFRGPKPRTISWRPGLSKIAEMFEGQRGESLDGGAPGLWGGGGALWRVGRRCAGGGAGRRAGR